MPADDMIEPQVDAERDDDEIGPFAVRADAARFEAGAGLATHQVLALCVGLALLSALGIFAFSGP